jgi:hypothetical protein
MTVKLNSQQIDYCIQVIAEHPEQYAWGVRQQIYLETMPFWSILYPVEAATGVVGKIADVFASMMHLVCHGKTYLLAHNNPHSCGYTGLAFQGQNMFDQKYIQHFTSHQQFFDGLQDGESGVFSLGSCELDHRITIIKYFEESEKYKVVQSYVKCYTLKDFLHRWGHEFEYQNFQDLKQRFLQPFYTVLDQRGPFTEKEIAAFAQITKVRQERWLGEQVLREGTSSVCRTTDVPQDNSWERQTKGFIKLIHLVSTIVPGIIGFLIMKRLYQQSQ